MPTYPRRNAGKSLLNMNSLSTRKQKNTRWYDTSPYLSTIAQNVFLHMIQLHDQTLFIIMVTCMIVLALWLISTQPMSLVCTFQVSNYWSRLDNLLLIISAGCMLRQYFLLQKNYKHKTTKSKNRLRKECYLIATIKTECCWSTPNKLNRVFIITGHIITNSRSN